MVLAGRYAFRNSLPCADGSYPAMLFRVTSRFNHSCTPNAGNYTPGFENLATVASCKDIALRTFAIDAINTGTEVCICYLSEEDQLSPRESRQAALQNWGFTCECKRCAGAKIGMDSHLKGASMEDFENEAAQSRAISEANREYRRLFVADADDYDPPKDDFEATVTRLSDFMIRFTFLDKANMVMQRCRRELLAALLIDGIDGPIGRSSASAVARLLIEHMQVHNTMLPLLSPCKVATFAKFQKVLKNIPSVERDWLERSAKEDGVDLYARQALWLHDPEEAKRLGVTEARNLPPLPALGPPPRTGPLPKPGNCCMVALGEPPQQRPRTMVHCTERRRWPKGCRPGARAAAHTHVAHSGDADDQMDEMPELATTRGGDEETSPALEDGHVNEPKLMNLWEAYADYGHPSATALTIMDPKTAAAARPKKNKTDSWFKFK